MSAELTESLRIEPAELPREAVIFGSTVAMREVRATIDGALFNNFPVLIQGESGTGKELVAQFVHVHSSVSSGPFVKLNCAATPTNLLEGELFGYESGAFPGITESRRGVIENAEGGTLFLDEISEMDLGSQAKLLGVLRDGHFSRVGGSEELPVRVRVICATSADLSAAVAQHAFHQDLLSGLSVTRLHLLPLRERRGDIPLLCGYLLEKLARTYNRPVPRLSVSALEVLKQWKWPGNMRELENWIARIIIFGTEEVLGLDLSPQLTTSAVGQRHRRIAHLRPGISRARRPRGGG
jgi:DNA-binding NtrC family response regulator